MNFQRITAIAFALGIVALSGCVSDQAEKVNEQDVQNVLTQMQASPGWKFAEAESRRDAKAMFAIAQDSAKKNPESGKKLYARCAFVAAMQQNKALLSEITAVDSSVKKYESLLQKGASSLLPQLVKVNSVSEGAKVGPELQPVWGDFVADCYENLTKEDAEVIAANVNSARGNFSAEDLLSVAKQLSKYTAKTDIPACFTVKQLITEAVNLAEVAHEQKILTEIADFCKGKAILSEREQKELAASVKAAGQTRASYIDFETTQANRTRVYRRGNYNVTNVRLEDGTTLSYRSNRLEDAFIAHLKSSAKLRRLFNRGMGVNSSYMSPDTMQQVASTVALICRQKGISPDEAIQQMAEAMSNF